ncbi:Cytochrome P450 monooxygenase [Pseudocercospora fuligena]|uniref:Cytochrome P450 monooxygenase n=1 Tax=Pseudocercospora fuligena TaxID=685502 RepID=A0A8H6RRN8_9PEZI|nr:Cytochrome P450 monooxygenase [Pseudocercospora fuligena]
MQRLFLFQPSTWLLAVIVAAIGTLCSFLYRVAHLLFYHPLRSYPGPKLWAISRVPWHYYNIRGDLARKILDLHETYGPTVRIAPDELSYTSSQAWRKIYGQSKPEFMKCTDGRGIAPVIKQAHLRGIIAAESEKHRRLRRAIAPAFSDRALSEQEAYLQEHSDNLVNHLRKACNEGAVDIVKWLSLATFDIMSDLAFGKPEGCLDNADQPWLSVMGARAKTIRWHQLTIYYGLDGLATRFAPKSFTKSRQDHMRLTAAKVQQRIKLNVERKDFMSYILQNTAEPLSNAELTIMASAFIVAGSGTSARALSATVYFLCANSDVLFKVTSQIRSAFDDQKAITIRSTARLPYLQACIDEAMRLHPPNPSTIPRWVPDHGEEIDGKWVPGGIAVGCHQLASGHAEWNFERPKEYIPERWLDNNLKTEFAGDDKSSVQPFSFGPRSCIGRSLAYAEMRLILAKLLFVFDLQMDEPELNWTERQKNYLTWEQIPLMIRLDPR